MAAFIRNFLDRSLKKYPLLTNSVVYGTLYTAAEMSQQTANIYYKSKQPEYDFGAAARIACIGSMVYSPTLFHWYKFLDKTFKGKSLKVVVTKVAVDQSLMTPTLIVLFFTAMGIMERKDDIFEELREKFWRTFWANQTFWIPAQTINFFLIPSHLRVVYVASMSFIWINVLCYIKRDNSGNDNKSIEK